MASHAAFELAVQVQSRVVLMATDPVMPSAGAASLGAFSTDTWHFATVGAVTEMDEEVPVQAADTNHSAQMVNGRARMAAMQSAIALPSRIHACLLRSVSDTHERLELYCYAVVFASSSTTIVTVPALPSTVMRCPLVMWPVAFA